MSGKAWNRSKIGVRVVPLGREHDEMGLADPARGEKVLRCAECGLPDLAGNRVITGTWTYRSVTFAFELCEREIRRRFPMDPRDGDPLGVVA